MDKIGNFCRRNCDSALAIKSDESSLSQNYSTLENLIESAVIVLLGQGYTYNSILTLISVTITVSLGKLSSNTAKHILEEVRGLMAINSANVLNILTQRRRQFESRSLLRRVAFVTTSPKETVRTISVFQ